MMSDGQAEPLLRQCHIVAYGTLRREIRQLAEKGLLDGDRLALQNAEQGEYVRPHGEVWNERDKNND